MKQHSDIFNHRRTNVFSETQFTKGVGVTTPNCFVIKRISLFGKSMQVITYIQIKRKSLPTDPQRS